MAPIQKLHIFLNDGVTYSGCEVQNTTANHKTQQQSRTGKVGTLGQKELSLSFFLNGRKCCFQLFWEISKKSNQGRITLNLLISKCERYQ